MSDLKSTVFALLVLMCGFSSVASADIIVYSETVHHNHNPHGDATFRVSYSHGVNRTFGVASDNVIVVNRRATWWVKPAYGTGRIRITVPLHLYLASWDVGALERELERLGVKIKSKPVIKTVPKPGPKAGQVISG